MLLGGNLENIIKLIERFVWSTPLILILIITHVFFTIKLKFPQFHMLQALKYLLNSKNDKKDKNNSSYKTLMATLAGTLGVGNIVGVATGICDGGIGVVFWIAVSGFFAIATKYAETYIVLKYRKKDKEKKYYGGTMYVLKERLDNKYMAIFFSIFVVIASFGIGAMIQSNSATENIVSNFNVNVKWVAVLITVLCAYVLLGNSKKIANVSSILVPIASIIYILMCLIIIFKFKINLINAIGDILNDALNIKAFATGTGIMYLLNMISVGLSKGMFSNEAGIGSSPMFDVTSNNTEVEKQSLIASLAVFIDTLLVCTLTGITVAVSYEYIDSQNVTELINNVFSNIPYGNLFLTISLSIFAIATIPCWSYYGQVAVNFLFGNKKIYIAIYNLIYIVAIYIGCMAKIDIIWAVSSIANALMCIPNIYMLIKLNQEIYFKSSHKFFTKMK